MDAVVKSLSTRMAEAFAGKQSDRPTREEAEAAVRTLIRWAGDDPTREGLRDTPQRVVKAYRELYAGYGADPAAVLEYSATELQGPGYQTTAAATAAEARCR